MRERQIAYGLTRIFTSLSMTFVLGLVEGLIDHRVWLQQWLIICLTVIYQPLAPQLCINYNDPTKTILQPTIIDFVIQNRQVRLFS